MTGRRANGRSSIYRGSDGRWHGYVSMGVKDNGKPDRRHVQGGTEKVVTAKVRDLERRRDAALVTTPGKVPTVGDWLTYWLDNVAVRKVRPSTLQGYRSWITQHLAPGLGGHRLDRLQPEHVDRFYRSAGESLAPASVLQMHRILSRALTVAVQRGRVPRNVCSLVDAPSVTREEVEPLSQADARAIIAVAMARPARRNVARWSVALALGLRQGEALGLTWEYVDLDTQRIRIRWQLQRIVGRGLVFTDVKSRAGRRTLILPDQLAEALREHQAMQDAERGHAGDLWELHGPPDREPGVVFAQPNGRPIDPRQDWAAWKSLLRSAGVRDARLHDARHTAASLMLAAGVPARVVMEILGHSQISLTLGTYSHVAPEVSRAAAERMGGALWD